MSNKNTVLKKRCKTSKVKHINNSDNEQSKLDEKFAEKCYFYGLPESWESEYTYLNFDERKKSKLTNIYNASKMQLANKAVSICDILKVVNITHEERLEMLEDYSIMQSNDNNIKEYLEMRKNLWDKINFYNERKITFTELTEKNLKKQQLSKMTLKNNETEERILALDVDEYTQSVIYQKYLKLKTMTTSDSEYHKLKEWIDIVISIPYNISKPIADNNKHGNILLSIKQKLDAKLYGMQNVKEEILLFIKQKLDNPNSSNLCLALSGAPGTGKTMIIKTLGEILKIPFEHISMGGCSNTSFLNGSSYVYEGSKCGKIVDTLIKQNCNNGIIFFDEIDKIDSSTKGQAVEKKLIHMIDSTQNSTYNDDYMTEINIDLSKIWFMFSLNDENNINKILRDRMYIIKVPEYNFNDKLKILNDYLIPEISNCLKMSGNIIIPQDVQKHIISRSKEQGIRELKRVIELIYRKLNMLCSLIEDDCDDKLKLSFTIKNFSLNHTLTIEDVSILLKNYDVKAPLPCFYI